MFESLDIIKVNNPLLVCETDNINCWQTIISGKFVGIQCEQQTQMSEFCIL